MENKKYIQKQFNKKNRIAVLLVNFGGPHNLKSVKSFLYNLFSDPMVLNFPFISSSSHLSPLTSCFFSLFRNPLAWLISSIRVRASTEMYKKICPISPLIPITYLQQQKLQELLNRNELPIDVYVGFSYSSPYIEDVLENLNSLDYKKVVILPLYPQYSYTTTGSVELVVNKWQSRQPCNDMTIHLVKQWHTDEDYIQSYVNLINNSLSNLDLRSTEIIFSAHSIPLINIKNGDPYENHIAETVNLIVNKLSWKKRWHISYQSKIGPVKWLEPSTDKVIEEIAKRNKNTNILVVPISFTCEHVETIFEIGKLYKEVAKRVGIKKFARVPALNTNKYLIQSLYNQVNRILQECNDYSEVLVNWSR